MSNLSQENIVAWLLLIKTPKLGPVRIRHLLQHLGSPEKIIQASQRTLRELKAPNCSIRWLKQSDSKNISDELIWTQNPNHHCISILNPHYPSRLKEIHSAPALLFIKGNIDILNTPQIAIVGSRNPSADGRNTAFQFAEDLSQYGLVITSGLAQGIDAQSHKGALVAGATIAVCATGLDRIYPAKHHKLAQRIVKNGALLSEFLPGTKINKAYFPRRNRLISGLSIGTLVIEASLRSGSLITAQCALEQGREVFAIPSSIHNPIAKGCHKLIKQGAKLVENTNDVIEEIQSHIQFMQHALNSKQDFKKHVTGTSTQNLDANQRALLEVMTYKPMSIDEIISITQQKAEDVSSMLLILELEGQVNNLGLGNYSRC